MYAVDRVEPDLQSTHLADFFCQFDPLENYFSFFCFPFFSPFFLCAVALGDKEDERHIFTTK